MNITHKWTKFMALGCSHGNLIDHKAAAAVLEFKRRWNPKVVFHLGDWCDTAALRAGAKGSSDEGKPINCDIDEGLLFLEKLGVTHCTMGNHDERPYRYLQHPNAMVRELGEMLVNGIESRMKKLKISWVNTWDVRTWIEFGGYKFMHGIFFNVSHARDHAEAYGNCIYAHTHTTAMQKGRRHDNPTGYCVGTLAKISNMDYAKSRRQTMAWSQGLVYGEACGDKMGYVMLYENGQNGDWRLPV